MRTLMCLLLMLGQPSFAQSSQAEDQLRMFANCAGRLTAQLEHQWLMQSDGSEQTERQRAQMVSLIETIIPDGEGRKVLSWRTDARAAQRALLNRAQFATDPEDAVWATQMAEAYLADCTSFLLS